MTLTAKQKALAATVSLFVVSVALAKLIEFIATYVTVHQAMMVIGFGVFGFLFYTMYSLLLMKFKADEDSKP